MSYNTYTTTATITSGSVQALGPNDNSGILQVSGTFTTLVATVEITTDPVGTTSPAWNAIEVLRLDNLTFETSPTFTNSTVRTWSYSCPAGVTQVRLNAASGTVSSGCVVRLTTGYNPAGAFSGTVSSSSVGGNQAITGSVVITSASANALTAGPGGSTNPSFNVDASTASAITGVNIKSAGTGAGVAMKALGGTNEAFTIDAKGSGALILNDTATGPVYLARGALAALQVGLTLTALGTTQSSTPTSAQLLGGFLTQTGATGAGAVTLPTGTALSTACNRTPVAGDSFDVLFANLGGGQTLTITGATGTTVVSGGAVATAKSALLRFINTAANAWSIAVVGG